MTASSARSTTVNREDEALRAAASWKTYVSSWRVDDGR
jgi:hypothetical protein